MRSKAEATHGNAIRFSGHPEDVGKAGCGVRHRVAPRRGLFFAVDVQLEPVSRQGRVPCIRGRALASEQEDDAESRMSGLLISILENAFPALNASSRFLAEIREFMDKLRIDNAIPELMAVSHSHLTRYIRDKEQPIYAAVSECMRQWQRSFPELMYNDYHLTKLTFMVSASLRYKSKRRF